MNAPRISDAASRAVAAFIGRDGRNFIDGAWVGAVDGRLLTTEDPATGQPLARFARGGAEDIDRAVAAARRAFDLGPWRDTTPRERARLLRVLADLVTRDAEMLALLETRDNGKPYGVARAFDLNLAIDALHYNAGWATKLTGETLPHSLPGEWHTYTLREPVGVAGLIVPWNVPFTMAVSKLAPALAAGCTVVLKPAEQTPLTTIRLAELCEEAGFPPGVVNLVTGLGSEAGAALVAHPGVDKISFTGSTATGRGILSAASGNFKRVSLELGGKSPTIILPDADLSQAIPAAAMGIFANTGQVCAAGSRLFAHEAVFDTVIQGIARIAEGLRLGPGTASDSDLGPVISQSQMERVLGYVETGTRAGATLVTGGRRARDQGYFVTPTIFVDTDPDMAIMREEIFGPVLCASRFGDDADIATLANAANATEYGLSASVWTRDLANAHRLARRIRSGTVKINAGPALDSALPFGGMKHSGWGRENGREGVLAFTELKTVAMKLA
ncbi:MAG: aldehyde dehydrogenase family protein [Rhodobacteraceae bacterium]|nr:aldehyde dehydrogenase family protein [Paracoccaceae bacterium]